MFLYIKNEEKPFKLKVCVRDMAPFSQRPVKGVALGFVYVRRPPPHPRNYCALINVNYCAMYSH